jgi:uncharacterized membrane protein
MLPGVPALLLLLFATVLGSCVGLYSVVSSGMIATQNGKLNQFAVLVFSVALPFWLWATRKVIATGDHDYGAATFACVLLSSLMTIRTTRTPDDGGFRLRWPLTVACALVAANYLYVLVAVDGLPFSFEVYLAIGAVWWSLATAAAYQLDAARPSYTYERQVVQRLYRTEDDVAVEP